MHLIVGLGNIGKEYDGTRHNIGFETLDYLSDKKGIAITKKEQHGLTGVYREAGHKIMLAKPTTYMNNSGLCVAGLMNFYQIPLENLLVIYDDIDLAIGDVRIRQRGSAGTITGCDRLSSIWAIPIFPASDWHRPPPTGFGVGALCVGTFS